MDCLGQLPVNFGGLLLAFGIVMALYVMWKIQRSPKPVDFVDLVLDENGKASWTRIVAIGTFLFSTWLMAHLELSGKMDSAYFFGYVGTFVGGAVAYQYRPPRGAFDGQQDIRVSSPAGSQVGVRVDTPSPPGAGS